MQFYHSVKQKCILLYYELKSQIIHNYDHRGVINITLNLAILVPDFALHQDLLGVVDHGLDLVDEGVAGLVGHDDPVLLLLLVPGDLPQLPPHHDHHHCQVDNHQHLETELIVNIIFRCRLR